MDYELIDSGNGRRLERFGKYILNRPDPEVMWQKTLPPEEWAKADAKFTNNKWVKKPNFPEKWEFDINKVKVNLKLTPFKHVGIFPEQSWQWDKISSLTLKKDNILNLFGYTGVATLVIANAGAKVTHVDASKPALNWFRENQKLNNLMDKPIRIILDDCIKFTKREIKRGVKYDAIIMDPPVYGHGPNGEVWDFNKHFPQLLDNCVKLLSNNPKFILVNAYAISTSSVTLANILRDKLSHIKGNITHGELSLIEKSAKRTLTTGIWGMWEI